MRARIPYLLLGTQRAIADYLDVETGRIDALLTKKRRMIELLEERRYSVITTAVNGAEGSVSLRGSSRTTGSRRAGGAMVTIGPSILRLANFVNGSAFRPSDLGEKGLPVVRIRQLLDSHAPIERAVPPDRPVVIDRGDLIFSWSATLAVRHWYGGRALLNQHLFRVDPFPGVNQRWLGYVLRTGIEHLKPLMHGSAMTHITRYMLKMLCTTVPDPSQQESIANYLDAETNRIDSAIDRTRLIIDLLGERRQSLITAAVLGEFSVPGVAV